MLSDKSASSPCKQLNLLLALPAELRNVIYHLILCQPQGSSIDYVSRGLAGRTHRDYRRRFCANILLTCKHVNIEATPILYTQNVFHAHESLLATMPSMLLASSPTYLHTRPILQLAAIKRISRFYLRVRLDTDPRYTASQVQESFNGVEELDIEVFQSMFDSCSFAKLSLFEGLRDIKKAVVRGSVGDGRYAAWLANSMMLPMGTEAVLDEHIVEGNNKQKPYSWVTMQWRVTDGPELRI